MKGSRYCFLGLAALVLAALAIDAAPATIEGTVRDAAGTPIAGAEIRFKLSGTTHFEDEVPTVQSDGDGHFVIPDVRPGERWTLRISQRGFAPEEIYATAPTGEPLQVVLTPGGRLSGRIVDVNGTAIAGIRCGVSDSPGNWRRSEWGGARARTNARGRFVLADLAPGHHRLRAYCKGYQVAELAGVEVEAGGARDGLVFVLEAERVVRGRLTDPGGTGLEGATIALAPDGTGRSSSCGKTDGEGRFRCEVTALGSSTVTATHGYRRAAEKVDVQEGSTRVDLVLEAGFSVSGEVVGPRGEALAGASVKLWRQVAPSRYRTSGGAPVETSGDGAFRFEPVSAGVYVVEAGKRGFVAQRGAAVEVDGDMDGLEIRLELGTTLRGRIRGLAQEELAQVDVKAHVTGPPLTEQLKFGFLEAVRSGQVDDEGAYTLEDLGPGTWNVTALLGRGGGREASGTVTIEAGAAEAELDLEFRTGGTLSGLVLKNGAPLAGAEVGALRWLPQSSARTMTDQEGRFRLEHLPAGTYWVMVADMMVTHHAEEMDLVADDREVTFEIRTSTIEGHVRETSPGDPIRGVELRLEWPMTEESSLPLLAGRMIGGGGRTTSDSQGFFRFADVPEGTWRLVASKDGYAPARRTVESGEDRIELALPRTEGIRFQAVLASGTVPSKVTASVLDSSGREITGGTYRAAGTGGSFRITTVPAGSWKLWIGAKDGAFVQRSFTAPGELGQIVLPPAGKLKLTVAELEGRGQLAWVTLQGPDGKVLPPVNSPEGHGGRWSLFVQHKRTFTGLLPGVWSLTLEYPDGRTWTRQATVTADATVDVDVP